MVWCWWCCHPFEGPELHMPFKYDDRLMRFSTMGTFCSWPCVKAYSMDNGRSKWGEYQMYITLMRKHMYGKVTPCRTAPKRQCLKVFGGTMTIEEFRECKEPPIVRFPNEIQMFCSFMRQESMSLKTETDDQKLRTIQSASGQTDTLKLKRNKPLKRTESSLEKSLGIKRKTS